MDIYKNIKLNYGQQVLQLACKLEKTAMQLASWKNHLTFNHRCKRLNVTPSSLRLHTNVQGQAAYQIITAAQKKLITIRIGQCHERLRRLHITHQYLTVTLASSLPLQDFINLTMQIQRQAYTTFKRTKDHQRIKLSNLLTPKPRAPPHRRLSIEAGSQCDAPLLISTHRTPPPPPPTPRTAGYLTSPPSP
jgi:hypothetical protein